jgi:hypothetical protein
LSNGGVKCWGGADGLVPVDVLGLTSGVAAIVAGGNHTCALTTGGGVKCWGSGELGDGTTTTSLVPVDVSGLASGVSAIATGADHTCAVTHGGGVKCWGTNLYGQLGNGITTEIAAGVPVEVSGLASNVIAIAAGNDHACALTSRGGVKCWGNNGFGQVGIGTTAEFAVPIPVDASGLVGGVIEIAAAGWHTCARTRSSGVKCWGADYLGQLGIGAPSASAAPSPTADESATSPWTATGNMVTPRQYHTATLLYDGRVLVAGGGNSQYVAQAELYDPNTGTWTATGKMIEARYGHTATLLLDGTVLVSGGIDDNSGVLSSAELYDPTSGKWTATGKMATARIAHTATLLPDGTVLVAGGSASSSHGGELASAELYDPSIGAWTATGSLIEARYGHTTTRLRDGAVLAGGGFVEDSDINGALASTELYDPGSRSWAATGTMHEGRAKHTATLLLDGTVLVAGFGALASAELYDPNGGSWSGTGSMTEARSNDPTATLLPDGRVLVTGGGSLASAELYDPRSGTWSAVANMVWARYDHTATLLTDGRVLVAGGSNSQYVAQAELYDPGGAS